MNKYGNKNHNSKIIIIYCIAGTLLCIKQKSLPGKLGEKCGWSERMMLECTLHGNNGLPLTSSHIDINIMVVWVCCDSILFNKIYYTFNPFRICTINQWI